jgi:hypothetical protein
VFSLTLPRPLAYITYRENKLRRDILKIGTPELDRLVYLVEIEGFHNDGWYLLSINEEASDTGSGVDWHTPYANHMLYTLIYLAKRSQQTLNKRLVLCS